jgi:serine/threonine-protein kinase RsbW
MTIPARPEFVHVLRSVVASIAARLDFPYADLEELRIVVDEACAFLLALPTTQRSLVVRIVPTEGSVEVTVCTDGEAPEWPVAGARDGLSWQVLSGLSDEASFERWDGRPAVRVSKALHPPREAG